jgi:hypothetical protein
VSTSHIDDRIGAIIKYAAGSQPPVFATPTIIPPDWMNHLQFLIESGFRLAGISQLSAGSEKPAGLNSGKALREFTDIESVRFAQTQKAWERMFLDLARLVVKRAERYWADSDKTVNVRSRKFIEKIKFKEIKLEDHQYDLSMFPTSMLPLSPAARYAQIDDWVAGGYVGKDEAMQLMQFPDLDRFASLSNAAMNDIDATIDDMLYFEPSQADIEDIDGYGSMDEAERELAVAELAYRPPEPAQNLALGVKRMTATYLDGRHNGIPQARLELLMRWIQDAQELMSPPQPPPELGVNGPMPVGQGPTPLPDAGLAPPPGMMPPPGMVPGGMMPPPGMMG